MMSNLLLLKGSGLNCNVCCASISQIDFYEDLHADICKLEDFGVFGGWFRVDIKIFKMSLLNTLKKWSWLFKEHLLTHVTKR